MNTTLTDGTESHAARATRRRGACATQPVEGWYHLAQALLCLLCGTTYGASPPNFVFILGEGHGWSSTSVQMDDTVPGSKSGFVRTPNLERLAQAGMRFANFYAPSPRCTPSRASLLTGKSPAQLHMTFVNEGKRDNQDIRSGRVLTPASSTELSSSETTLAELLRQAGYATAHFGKWHLGKTSPSQHGFDENDGANGNGGPDEVANPHPKQLYAMTERGLEFMTRQVRAGKPFYLQLSHYAARQGGDASPQAVAAVKGWGIHLNERQFAKAAADLDLDIALGMVLKRLEELALAGNTFVLFTTDHGSPGRNPPLSGGKGTVSEGGVRVPFIVRGPGVKAGACSHVRAFGEDVFPTIAALARLGGPLPQGIEGGSLAAVLANGGRGQVQRPADVFVVHFPHYDKDSIGPASAIYLGDFKLIRPYETGVPKLFDVAKDPAEHHDLAAQTPDKVSELNQRLTQYLVAVGASLPSTTSSASPPVPEGHSTITQCFNIGIRPGTISSPEGTADARAALTGPTEAFQSPAASPTRHDSRQPLQTSRCNEVPAHPFDLILGRPTSNAVTVSVLCCTNTTGLLAYGTERGHLNVRTPNRPFIAGQPAAIPLSGLQPDTQYFYQFVSSQAATPEFTFHTARPRNSAFTFTITADSHLDEHTDAATYQQTLANALADAPDFHIDLGDTFMTEKHPTREAAARQYLAQRYYFGRLCHSAPLFLVLGNHDGESPRGRDADSLSLAVWSNLTRKRYFPNPVPDSFYTGDAMRYPEAGLLEDYYAWEWGDALFIVLDPFWFSQKLRGQTGNWKRTLGTEQYQWLKRTLENSRAAFKFVLVHHLVGGLDEQCRGGAEAALLYEWGGRNTDGSDEFAEHRPGWPAPIHQLLVSNHVSAVFHGHDHLYARQELDGVVYQEVPQPGTAGNRRAPRSAAEYGYRSGTILGGSGHLRVEVSAQGVQVRYIGAEGAMADCYTMRRGGEELKR